MHQHAIRQADGRRIAILNGEETSYRLLTISEVLSASESGP